MAIGGNFYRIATAAISSVILFSASASAQSNAAWTGLGANTNWSTPLNWSQSRVPFNLGTAAVTMAGTHTLSNVDVPWSISTLIFNSTAGEFTISGTQLTLGAGGIVNSSNTYQTFTVPLVFATDQTWTSGGVRYSSIDTAGHNLTMSGAAGSFESSGVGLTGSGALIMNLAASVSCGLYGANSHSGGTFFNSGRVYLGDNTSLGAPNSPAVFNGGIVAFSRVDTITHNVQLNGAGTFEGSGSSSDAYGISGNISGPGALNFAGGGRFWLTGQNTNTGGIVANNSLVMGNTNSLRTPVSLLTNGGLWLTQDFDGTLSQNVTGAGTRGLEKHGTGTVTLTGTNTYTAQTAIYTGALEINGVNSGAIPAASPILFYGGGGVIQVVGGGTFSRSNVTWPRDGGFAARNGKLNVNIGGAGATLDFGFSNTTGMHGPIVLGSPQANDVTEFQNPIYVGTENTTITAFRVIPGTGGDYAIASGLISGNSNIEKSGDGTLQLTAHNTFGGELIITAGAVQTEDRVGLPANARVRFSGGVLMNFAPATLTRSIGGNPGNVAWTLGGGGFASGAGVFNINLGGNSQTLTWNTASFVPNNHPLMFGAIRAAGEVNFVNPIDLGLGTREIRVIPGLGGDFATLSGSLSGLGGINKTGAGVLRVAAINFYTGATTITAGTLLVSGSLAGSAITVQPGASLGGTGSVAGQVTVTGGLTPATAGAINLIDGTASVFSLSDPLSADTALTLGGTTAGSRAQLNFEVGSTADLLRITTAGLLVRAGGATINIAALAGLVPGTYDLITFPAGRAAGLTNLSLGTPTLAGYFLSLQSTATSEQLVVSLVPEPGSAMLLLFASAAMMRRSRRRARLGKSEI